MNISDSKSLLTSAQISLLQSCAAKPFMLGGFMSLDDILTKLKVDVFIEPGKPTYSVDDYYDKAIEYWRNEFEKLREKMREDDSLREEYRKKANKFERLYSERQAHSSMRLLGLYNSKKNIIILYPEAMAAADASRMDEYLASTLAHEVMHAYFDRPGHEKYPYAVFVEEPLAEFGMLLYMHETHSTYYDWAHNNVSGKKCCYGYGAVIMDQYLGGDKSLKTYLEDYKLPIGEYEMLDISNGRIIMPVDNGFVNVNGQPLAVKWIPLNIFHPTYFWDDATKTLGLDGDWSFKQNHFLHRHFHDIQHLYLGKDFIKGYDPLNELFFATPITVSPQHKNLTSINGILVWKNDNSPAFSSCGNNLYKLKRNGKYGIIDSNLNPITLFQYDHISRFDNNGLCEVKIDDRYGLVNKQGVEQVPVIYERISRKGLLYEVKLNDEEFTIDVSGNKIV